jgi:predicted RNA-binding protein
MAVLMASVWADRPMRWSPSHRAIGQPKIAEIAIQMAAHPIFGSRSLIVATYPAVHWLQIDSSDATRISQNSAREILAIPPSGTPIGKAGMTSMTTT